MSCNVRKLSNTNGYNVVKGRVQRNLNIEGGMQILNNLKMLTLVYVSRMVKSSIKVLKLLFIQRMLYFLMSGNGLLSFSTFYM